MSATWSRAATYEQSLSLFSLSRWSAWLPEPRLPTRSAVLDSDRIEVRARIFKAHFRCKQHTTTTASLPLHALHEFSQYVSLCICSQFGNSEDASIVVEQEYTNAEEGSVVWDASRSFLAHITYCRDKSSSSYDWIAGQRVLEIGSGTGVVGLALARLGASSVVMTDKDSQLPLMRRNVQHNEVIEKHAAPVASREALLGAVVAGRLRGIACAARRIRRDRGVRLLLSRSTLGPLRRAA